MGATDGQRNWPDMRKTLGKPGFCSGEDRIRTTRENTGNSMNHDPRETKTTRYPKTPDDATANTDPRSVAQILIASCHRELERIFESASGQDEPMRRLLKPILAVLHEAELGIRDLRQ